MRIAVPTQDGKTISEHFGRARGFIIFEARNGAVEEVRLAESGFASGALEGHHDHSAIVNALDGCQAVISRGMGRRMVDDLKAAGIDVILTSEIDAASAVMGYLAGGLKDRGGEGCCGCDR